MIRSHYPTPEAIDAQRVELLPELRRYESDCRAGNPLPPPDQFSKSDRCRYHGYLQKMATFKPYSPYRESFVGILHSDCVGLVAAENAFRSVRSCLILLTPMERTVWFEQHPSIDAIGGWYWFVFWQIHTIVPDRFRHALTKYDIGSDCEPWIFTHGRGSSAWHELWSYNGNQAKLIDGSFSAIVAEDGPIEEWFE